MAEMETQTIHPELTALDLLQSVTAGRNAAESRVRELERELAQARNRPWRQVRDKLKFRLYTSLSSFCAPLSAKSAVRYQHRARKRDPNRSLSEAPLAANTPSARVVGASAFEFPGKITRDPTKQDVLIVSHEASRTGAPILTLNIAESLSARYNVTSLCLTGGDIIDDFCAVSEKVIDANLHSTKSSTYRGLIGRICAERAYVFAVVNSIEFACCTAGS